MRRSKTSSKLRALGLALPFCVRLCVQRCAQSCLPLCASLGLLGAACGSSAVINTRHEEMGTLAGRATYAFTDAERLSDQGFTTGHLFNPIMQRRIRDELTRELGLRGYSVSPPESANLWVTFSAGSRQDLVTQGKQEGPVVYGPAYTIDRGALVLHFIDPKTGAAIWRGWGDAIIKPGDDLDTRVRAAVRQIMASFPAAAPPTTAAAP